MDYAMDCKVRIFALSFLLLSACGKAPDTEGTATIAAPPALGDGSQPVEPDPAEPAPPPKPLPPKPAPAPLPAPAPAPAPAPPLSGPPTVWNHLPAAQAWNNAVLGVVRANIAKFEKARDREVFCPGYSTATDAQRLTCWVRLVSAMVQYESAFNQNANFSEPGGGTSVGLMMMSAGECPNAPTVAALKNGVENLKCGTARMAMLIARDGYVTAPNNVRGAAAYWSVLRAPYTNYGLKLGKKPEILKISTKYKQVHPIIQP